LIILLCVFSRIIAIPVYLRQLGFIDYLSQYDRYFNMGSKFFLFASGISGAAVILLKVVSIYRQRRKIQKTLQVIKKPNVQMADVEKAA
jgi:heme exporter protein D